MVSITCRYAPSAAATSTGEGHAAHWLMFSIPPAMMISAVAGADGSGWPCITDSMTGTAD
ncbi:MAG: hypothetical protein MZV70_34965 [Desulfobacterales bacterium]|nr:hypothetical protein [Desulfobacterales bacterium]